LHSALVSLIRFIVRGLLSLLVIASILAGGRYLLEQGRALRASNAEIAALTDAGPSVAAGREALLAMAQRRALLAQQDSLADIDRRLAQLDQQLAAPRETPLENSMLLRSVDTLAAHYQDRLRREAARQEQAYLQRLRAYLVALSGRQAALAGLAQLQARHRDAYAQYTQRKTEKERLSAFQRLRMETGLLPGARLAALQQGLESAAAASNAAEAAVRAQQQAIERVGAPLARPDFVPDLRALDALDHELAARLAQARSSAGANPVARVLAPVGQALPLALLVLLSSLAAHLLVKLLFYYVLAPLAGRRPPIRLEAPPKPVARVRAAASAVSQTIRLESGQELLLLPDYLQSSSTASIKDTRWLLDWRCPWTSLIAGMVMLTRVRTARPDDAIVVSSNADPLSELALIEVPAGAALVFQPRALVGIVHHAATPLNIERRWQLLSAHAWLTLQLRYLIFRGPVTLIARGTRGVRVEPAGTGRLISQAATLGFSSQLAYATARSAAFIPYYLNKTPLLDDRFEGEGVYIYAETPHAGRRRGGFVGRGLEGLADALLKVFGI
jgi:hypothetical protein